MIPLPSELSLFFSNWNTLIVLSTYYDLSESYNTFHKQDFRTLWIQRSRMFPCFQACFLIEDSL